MNTEWTGPYSIVMSDAVEAFVATEGDLGARLSLHDSYDEAFAAAQKVAYNYDGGVEIVDEATWTIQE